MTSEDNGFKKNGEQDCHILSIFSYVWGPVDKSHTKVCGIIVVHNYFLTLGGNEHGFGCATLEVLHLSCQTSEVAQPSR